MDDAFSEFAALAAGEPRRTTLREWLIKEHLPVARHIAQRFAGRGQPDDDLVQVAMLGLVNAVDRFDPDRGSQFLAFAIPTIMGEVRRYFRDHTWSVRVPRRLQALHLSISNATAELAQVFGRPPKPSEIAHHLDIAIEDVYEGLGASNAYRSISLDRQLADDDEGAGTALGERLGDNDAGLEHLELQEALRPLLATLPDRERRIVTLRFFGTRTQTQIAHEIGISQMHVSRLLAKALGKLRTSLLDERAGSDGRDSRHW